MSNPNNPYGSQPEQGYSQSNSGQLGYDPNNPYGSQPEQGYSQMVGPPGYGQPGIAPMQPQYGPPGSQAYPMPMTPVGLRPSGITIIAVWSWILAGLIAAFSLIYLLVGGTFIGVGAGMAGDTGDMGGMVGMLGGAFLVSFLFMALICGLFIMIGRRLWQLKNSGRMLAIVVYGLLLALNLLSIIGGDATASAYIFAAISAAIVGYLFVPDVRRVFASSR